MLKLLFAKSLRNLVSDNILFVYLIFGFDSLNWQSHFWVIKELILAVAELMKNL